MAKFMRMADVLFNTKHIVLIELKDKTISIFTKKASSVHTFKTEKEAEVAFYDLSKELLYD